MSPAPQPAGPPRCGTCRHYFITYEPTTPHGCRLFGMRSRALPSGVVRQETGQDCAGWEPRSTPPPAPPRPTVER